jgi:hypothetical protein
MKRDPITAVSFVVVSLHYQGYSLRIKVSSPIPRIRIETSDWPSLQRSHTFPNSEGVKLFQGQKPQSLIGQLVHD